METDEADTGAWQSLPVSDGYDDDGMDAARELAVGDGVRVTTDDGTTLAGTITEYDSVDLRSVTWSIELGRDDSIPVYVGIVIGDGTVVLEPHDETYVITDHVAELTVCPGEQGVLYEVSVVYTDVPNSPTRETWTVRASDRDVAKAKVERQAPPIDRFDAVYEDVDRKLDIIAQDTDGRE